MTSERILEIRNWIGCLSHIYSYDNLSMERRVMDGCLELLEALTATEAALGACQTESESRRVALFEKAHEAHQDWIRAENAEAQVTTLTAALQAAEQEVVTLKASVQIHADMAAGAHHLRVKAEQPNPWSSTRPAVAGWYWLLENKPKAVPSIVRVEIERLDNRLLIYGRLGANYIVNIDGEWSGPLTPPGGAI